MASGDNTKLFVGGLSYETDEENLKNYFEKFGPVETVNIKWDKVTQKSRGFGFVKFKENDGFQAALKEESHYLDGKKIDPKPAAPIGTDPALRSKKIFVGGLSSETTEERMLEHFKSFGPLVGDIQFSTDKATGKKKGFCFIEFETEEIVDDIVKSKFHNIGGKQVETKRAYSKQQQQQLAAKGMWPLPGSREEQKGHASQPYVTGYPTVAGASIPGIPPGTPVIYVDPSSLGSSFPYISPAAGTSLYSGGASVVYPGTAATAYPRSAAAYPAASAYGSSYPARDVHYPGVAPGSRASTSLSRPGSQRSAYHPYTR